MDKMEKKMEGRRRMLLAALEEEEAEDEDVMMLACAAAAEAAGETTPKRWWVRPWSTPVERDLTGQYNLLMEHLRVQDVDSFHTAIRMNPDMFNEVLLRVGPRIEKTDTNFRLAHPPGLRLAVTLAYMAHGCSYTSMKFSWRMAHNSISTIVSETVEAIVREYAGELIAFPQTKERWKEMSQLFWDRWNFHHTLGAIDGKHIAIVKPANSGSTFFNYKKFFSIILLAICDANYEFFWVDIGTPGAAGDAQIFNRSEFVQLMEAHQLPVPDADPLPGDDARIPYFLVGDDAFAQRVWLQKPFQKFQFTREETVFNYRLSRARRCIENSFGILTNRWRCITTTMAQTPNNVMNIVHACVCMHNLMRRRYPVHHAALVHDREDGEQVQNWREDTLLASLQAIRGNRGTREARIQREYLKAYYNSPVGALPWQEERAGAAVAAAAQQDEMADLDMQVEVDIALQEQQQQQPAEEEQQPEEDDD